MSQADKRQQLKEDLISSNQIVRFSVDELVNQRSHDVGLNARYSVHELAKKGRHEVEYFAEVSSRKSCCCIFSLQTGVLLLCAIDVLVFVMILCITGMTVENFDEYSISNLTIQGVSFTMCTDGVCILLFFIRLLFAFWYTKAVLFPPKMDYQYIIEFGKLKWHTKRAKNMRIKFKNYALACNVSSVFIFIQTTMLLIVLWNESQMYFRYIFLLILSAFTMNNLRTVYAHLKELDAQVTYRIRTYSQAVLERMARKSAKSEKPTGVQTFYEAPE